ncbi:hypothetical protein WMF31_18165 [Sorangium sp. So ce1036]|uniref:hypothetical protein n=1 Tax=Sorangium sp. So ce1036 TaxID=3133328 RepID=UPI003EFC9D96
MRIAFLLLSCCAAPALVGCLKPKHGPPEFLLSPGVVRTTPVGDGTEPASHGNDYAGAAATLVGAAGATVVQREVYDICYASCQAGTTCDPETGMCVRLPCGGKCPADHRCKVVEGRETCVLGAPDRGVVPQAAGAGEQDLGAGGAPGEVRGPRAD